MSETLCEPAESSAQRQEGAAGASALVRTSRQSALALSDQVVVSGANLVTTMLVARFASPEELGAYALGFTIVQLIFAVQESLITTPYTVFGCRLPAAVRRELSGSAVAQTCLLALIAMAGLAGGAALLSLDGGLVRVAGVCLALAAVIPFLLLREFARRFTLADLHTGVTLLVDVAAVVLQLGFLAALAWMTLLSAPAAHVAIGIAGGCAGLAWLVLTHHRFGFRRERLRDDARRNWAFGRWFLVGQTTTVVQSYCVPWLLAITLGLEAAGVFAVCSSIIAFTNPVILGIGNILNPKAAWAFAEGGVRALRRLVLHTTTTLTLVTGVFALFMAIWGGTLAGLMFGAEFANYGMIVAILALGPLANALSMAAGYGLTMLERPQWHLITAVFGAVVTLAVSLALSPWGLAGAAWGSVAGVAAGTVLRCAAFWLLPYGAPAPVSNANDRFVAARRESLAPLSTGE